MPNDFYTEAFAASPLSLAKTEDVRDALKRVEGGFDKLPALRALLEDRVTAVVATSANGQAFTVTMTPAPEEYTDGIALNVRFPQTNEANPTLDILDGDGVSLGAKPIRDVNGNALTAAHIAANVRAELYYVDEGTGYWILGAGGARGGPGPPGPPDGEFYIISGTTQLGFRETDGTPIHNFGQIAFRDRGAYAAGTEYVFLDVVLSGGVLYWHHGLAATTGTGVADTTVWKPLIPGMGTAALANTGTGEGNVPVLGAGGKLPASTVPVVPFTALTFAAALEWDVGADPKGLIILTGNLTGITLSNDVDGGVYVLRLAQDATGDRTWAPPAAWIWSNGGTVPALSTAAEAVDVLTLMRMGSHYHAALAPDWQ